MNLPKMQLHAFLRVPLVGAVAAVVWVAGLQLVFGPAQGILADPEIQSGKFLEVFGSLEPLPRYVTQPVVFYMGILLVGLAFGVAYHMTNQWMPGQPAKKGFRFGVLAWLLMIPWFEFYLPWNVMHEPLVLVLLEMVLWFIVLQCVSFAVVYSYRFLNSNGS